MFRPTNVVNPDNTSTLTEYYVTGQTKRQFGARTYPVGYSYDYAGRMSAMTNWSNFGAGTGARVTTWNYNAYRGWLDNKRYPDNTGPNYAYTPAGRLQLRRWARGVNITNIYDPAGLLSTINYSDSTPWVSNTYDRRGRQKTVVRNGTTASFAYNNANQVLVETNSGGTLDTIAVTNAYDQFLRRTNLVAMQSSNTLVRDSYSYDAASRLQTVTDNTATVPYSATYGYLANSPLVSQILFKTNTTLRMTITKHWDFLNRLSAICNLPSSDSAISFTYAYNNANQRTRMTLADGSFWQYTYDPLGQVITGHKFFADQTPVAGQQFDYAFDDIGNRTQTMAGGDQNGSNQRIANYHANNLNQYTNRDVPGYVDIMGLAYATNSVTVNGSTAYRHGEYFRQQLPIGNSSGPQWTNITVSAPGQTDVSGHQFVATNHEAFAYDLDGNLTSDGRWNYGWDAENRLVAMTNNNASVGPQQVLHFEYDWKSRRIRKQGYANGSGTATNDLRFVYDGWNLVAEISGSNPPVRTYMWGLDLSGSIEGAGGVGGLVESVYYATQTTNCFVAFDGSGNVSALVSAAGMLTAQRIYGPFGESIRNTGLMAKDSPIRFSSKYQDDDTDMSYYGYRYFNPGEGRWINRDLIEEVGGANLYGFTDNEPNQSSEFLGLCAFCECKRLISPTAKFKPDPGSFSIKYQIDPGTGHEDSFYGFNMPIEWELEDGSEPSACTFSVKEKKNGVTGTRNGIPIPGSNAVDIPSVPNPHNDFPAVPLSKEGDYKIKVNIHAVYTCKGTDKTKTAPVNISFTFSFTLTPPDQISNLKVN
jgi:RHS repeat-associated protein